MKKFVRISISTLLSASFLLATPAALAVQSSTSASSEKQQTTTTQSDKEVPKTRTDRVTQYKKDHAFTFGAGEEAKLKTVCKAGQLKVKTLDKRVTTRNVIRAGAYKDITAHLTKIIARLKEAKVDTTELETEKTELAKRIATYSTSLKTYQTSLEDLAALDCQTDPAAFRSALEAARANRVTLNTDALAIRSYITDTIKVTLQTVRDSIKKPTTDDTTGEQ